MAVEIALGLLGSVYPCIRMPSPPPPSHSGGTPSVTSNYSGPETVDCPEQDTPHLGVVGPPLQRDIESAI